MALTLDARRLRGFHDEAFAAPGWPERMPVQADGVWQWIAENHRCNALLWREEDLARRRDVPDAEIVANKRAIDGYNQRRNDAIEAIDEAILAALEAPPPRPDAWLSSETAGAMIDRLSIASLKRHHMRLQAERRDADEAHRAACRQKLLRIETQRADLLHCLDALLAGMRDGRCHFKLYRQFKMYNDPALNPYLQAGAAHPGARAA